MATVPVSNGGICELASPGDCWVDQGDYMTLESAWKQYPVALSDIRQLGWTGTCATFDAKHLM